MIDYREELGFQISLAIFLTESVGINRKGRKILTIEKLRLLILICLTPKKLYGVIGKLTEKEAFYFQDTYYDDSSDHINENDLKEISLLLAFMCSSRYLEIVHEESKFIIIGEAASNYAHTICECMPYYLSKNVEIIRTISRKSEALISKALMES